jgi:hypothetical protein
MIFSGHVRKLHRICNANVLWPDFAPKNNFKFSFQQYETSAFINLKVSPQCFIQAFISPTNAQLTCIKILKFALKYTINAPTSFGLTKPSSGSLQSVLR